MTSGYGHQEVVPQIGKASIERSIWPRSKSSTRPIWLAKAWLSVQWQSIWLDQSASGYGLRGEAKGEAWQGRRS